MRRSTITSRRSQRFSRTFAREILGYVGEATADALSARWHENLDELRRHVDVIIPRESLDAITRLADQFLRGREELFARRITEGRIVDGHGDLMAQDIFCTSDGPVLLDCLEFDDQVRK